MTYTILKYRSSYGLYVKDPKTLKQRLLSIHETQRDAEKAAKRHYEAQR